MAIATVSPVTGEILKSFDELTPEELEDKLTRAAAAADSYRLTTVEQRAGWLAHAADNLEKEADSVSNLITAEMGKTYRAAQDEVAKCIRGLRFYAAKGPGLLQNLSGDARSVGAKQAYVSYLFREAGFPDDVFQTLLISARRVEQVLRDDRVKAATLTGSEPAGRSVATIAGSVIKKVVLELGGSDPFIVMPSTDLERGARWWWGIRWMTRPTSARWPPNPAAMTSKRTWTTP